MSFTLNTWFGRLGNNVQQISNAIHYAKTHKLNYIGRDHPLINKFDVIFGDAGAPCGRYFLASDFAHDPKDLQSERSLICQKYILPQFKFTIAKPLPADTLVIHLRGGDTLSGTNIFYVPNPLSFYKKIIKSYAKVLLVAEPTGGRIVQLAKEGGYWNGQELNPIISKLLEIDNVSLQQSSLDAHVDANLVHDDSIEDIPDHYKGCLPVELRAVAKDFSTLLRAQNLATSGVGTFPLAAALCSKNLKKFHYSNLFLREHLNPTLLEKSMLELIETPIDADNYIQIGDWRNTPDQRKTLLTFPL